MPTISYSIVDDVDAFTANSKATGGQATPNIAVNSGGEIGLVWRDFSFPGGEPVPAGFFRNRVFSDDNNYTPLRDEDVSGSFDGFNYETDLASLANGTFVTVYERNPFLGIEFQIFDSTGEVINSTTLSGSTFLSSSPGVASLAGGGFVATYTLQDSPGGSGDVQFAVFNSVGTLVKASSAIGDSSTNSQNSQSVAGLANGNFIVTWEENSALNGIIFEADGVTVAVPAFSIESTPNVADNLFPPDVIGLTNGNIVVTYWERTSGNVTLRFDMFDSNGTSLVDSAQIAAPANLSGTDSPPSVTQISDNYFAVTYSYATGAGKNVYTQIFDLSGNNIVGETPVSDSTLGASEGRSAGIGNGRIATAWTELDPSLQDSDSLHIALAGSHLQRTTNTSDAGETAIGDDISDIMTGGSGNDTLVGRGGDDELHGGAGNDFLDGGDGLDIMRGGEGDDIFRDVPTRSGFAIYGDAGDDTVVFDQFDGDLIIELGTVYLPSLDPSGSNIRAGRAFVENFVTGSGNDFISADVGPNIINSGSGNDNIFGAQGNDRLDGGPGVDVLAGGQGDDIYVVDNLGDRVGELADEGSDTVSSSVSFILGAHVENLVLTGTETIDGLGNELDNLIIGNDVRNGIAGAAGDDQLFGMGGDDTIDGQSGADTMVGGTGIDTYFLDNVDDTVVEEYDSGGFDTIWTTVDYSLPDNVEILILTGGALNINGTGNDGPTNDIVNLILGNAGNNTLTTFGGGDVVLGLDGNDTISTGAGADLLAGGIGNDILTGGAGNDLFAFASINEAADLITDFSTADVDLLDLRVMFGGAAGATSAAAIAGGFLSVTQSGLDTLVSADLDGGGDGFVFLAQLQNTTASAVEDFILV